MSKYSAEGDPNQEDRQLKNVTRFLYYLAMAKRLGTIADFSEELQKLGVNTTLQNNGLDFEQAVERRFAELRAKGEMPVLQRGGRIGLQGGGGGSTIWSRMGIGGRRE